MTVNFIKNISKEEYKDAFRLAIQSALAGAICYYLMVLLGISERFVGVLSAILVIEPSIGNTFQQAKGRILSTIVGIVMGFVFVALIPWELGVILSLLLSLFIINGIASFRPEWRYGVVAAVALALGSEGDAYDLALNRLLSIGFGVAIGIVISLIVWPDTSENRTIRYIRKALKNTCDRFRIEFGNTRDKENKKTTKVNNNFSTNINQAKNTAASITFNDKAEIMQLIDSTERLYNSITIIQRVADKSNSNITNGEAGIEKNSEKVTEKACEIIEAFSKKEKVTEDDLSKFSELISTTKSNIQIKVDDKELSLLRNTFMFGLTEIEDSIQQLYKNFKEQ
jgi:uncharacterized membrane protein YccC